MIEKVVTISSLGDPTARLRDRDYWLSRTPAERTDAVAFLRLQVLGPTEGFQRIAASFNANGVEYLVVGGYATAHHGAPRFTGDLELFVRPTADNALRITAALGAFRFGGDELTADDFCVPDRVIRLGQPPVRVELLTSIDGVTWEQAHGGAESCELEGQPVPVIGLREFVASKRASGRPTDLADLDSLGEA